MLPPQTRRIASEAYLIDRPNEADRIKLLDPFSRKPVRSGLPVGTLSLNPMAQLRVLLVLGRYQAIAMFLLVPSEAMKHGKPSVIRSRPALLLQLLLRAIYFDRRHCRTLQKRKYQPFWLCSFTSFFCFSTFSVDAFLMGCRYSYL